MQTKLISFPRGSDLLTKENPRKIWATQTFSYRCVAVIQAPKSWFKRYKSQFSIETYTHVVSLPNYNMVSVIKSQFSAVQIHRDINMRCNDNEAFMLCDLGKSSDLIFKFRTEYPMVELYKLPILE